MADQEQDAKLTAYMEMNALFATRTVAEHATHVLPYIKPDSEILDVGCGIGSMTIDFARRVPQGRVVGIDYNQDSINAATATYIHPNLTFQLGDATDLTSLPAASFDIVHAHQLLLHMPNPITVVKQFHRLLKPGGVLAIRDNVDAFAYPTTPAMDEVMDLYRTLAAKRGVDPHGGRQNHVWVAEGGFGWEVGVMDVGTVGWGYSTHREREMWAGNLRGLMRTAGLAMGLGSEELFDRHARDYDEWWGKDEAKVMGYDGWVIARKGKE